MKVQTAKPKYLCEYVDHRLYARRGMAVIGNWQKRVVRNDTKLQLDISSSGWYPFAILCKVPKWVFKGVIWLGKQLQYPRFKLPKSPVLVMKDLPEGVSFRDMEPPKRARQRGNRPCGRFYVDATVPTVSAVACDENTMQILSRW